VTQFQNQYVALIKMYPHIKFDECRTCTSREMELNVKSNQEWDGRMDQQTGQKLNDPAPL